MAGHSGSGSTGPQGWEDALGSQIASPTRNVIDIASHYNFSPERLRLFRNGSREFIQYGSISQFSDEVDYWSLQPDAGDSMHIESAESGTYVVNYLMQSSWAFALNQALSDGDVLRYGPYNGANGWYFEQRGTDHGPMEGDIIEERNGTETTLKANVSLGAPLTDWVRRECQFGWYNVLNQTWRETITDDGQASNDIFSRTSNDGARGPETGNLNLWLEVEASASTTDLELLAGSMGMITLGDPTSLNRDKPQYNSVTLSGTANAWEPVLALRIDPDNPHVNMQFSLLNILSYSSNATCELVVASFDASNTDASGWSLPEYHHDKNSAVETTTNVSQVANASGTQEDLAAGTKFGGYTIASSVDVDGGNISGSESTVNQNRVEKKSVLNSDTIVFLARTGTMDGTLHFVWDVDQNW